MSRAEEQAWLALRAESLERLGRLWKTSVRIRTGLRDVPVLLSLLEEFSGEAAMLEAHETLVAQWRTAWLVWPDPVLEALIARRRRRLASLHARVSAVLERRLGSLPRELPCVAMRPDGRFVLRQRVQS